MFCLMVFNWYNAKQLAHFHVFTRSIHKWNLNKLGQMNNNWKFWRFTNYHVLQHE